MSSFEYTEQEIREELARFGIKDIDQDILREFREDLLNLVKESSSSSFQNADISSSTSTISPLTCPNPSSLVATYTTASLVSVIPATNNRDHAKSHLAATPHTSGSYTSVNSFFQPSTVTHKLSQGPIESAGGVAICRNNTTNRADDQSDFTLGRDHTQLPSTNRSETEHGKQENFLHPFKSFDQPRDKENIYLHSFLPPPPTSSSESTVLVTKARQTTATTTTTTESDIMKNYLEEINNRFSPSLNTFVAKRKISRKGADGNRYIDESESVYSSSSSSSSIGDSVDYQDRLRELTNRDNYLYPRSNSSIDNRPRSIIIVSPTPPRLKKNSKTDPVNRFHEFQNYWNLHKAPGEDNHDALRWSIREKIAKKDVIESRPRKTFVANNYVIPSQKPRHSLRWQIRTDLAYGLMPPSMFNNK